MSCSNAIDLDGLRLWVCMARAKLLEARNSVVNPKPKLEGQWTLEGESMKNVSLFFTSILASTPALAHPALEHSQSVFHQALHMTVELGPLLLILSLGAGWYFFRKGN